MNKKFFKKTACFFLIIYLISVFIPSVRTYAAYDGYTEAISYRDNVKVASRFSELIFGKQKDKSKDNNASGKNSNDSSEPKDALRLIPSGDVFGIKIDEPYLTVTEACEGSPLSRGDRIISVGGIRTEDSEDITRALNASGGKPITVEIIRDNEKMKLTVTPKNEDGTYKLGITLREGTLGIGTVTYIDPSDLSFGGLGHGVYSGDGHYLSEIEEGKTCGVLLGSVKRGEEGKPGELSGVLTERSTGEIYSNTECGVFGRLTDSEYKESDAIPIGKRTEVKCGKAEIISTLKSGAKMTFDIEITEIDTSARGSKCFKIKTNDPALLAISGGIVRGMSGSPIIQDGKLVGAVTHVMVANPTEGYGIFIENMLNAAQNQVLQKAA